MICWKCIQKKEFFEAKLDIARVEAKRQSIELSQTMTIIKEGPNYIVKKASEVAESGIEYFSKFG